MDNLMNKYNLRHEFIEAVDGSKFSKKDLKKYLSTWRSLFTLGRLLRVGELACALSHLKCWKKMRKEGIEKVVVLEDDVFFNEKFTEFLFHINDFPKDWEFINLTAPANKMFYTHERFFDMYTLVKFSGLHLFTSAYILNLRAVNKFIDHFRFPITIPIDRYTGNDVCTGAISYGLDPQIVVVDLRFNTTIPSRFDLGILRLWFSFFKRTIGYIKHKYRVRRIRKKTRRDLQALHSKA